MSVEWRYSLAGLVISWSLGYFGADRFYEGQILWGIVKLITLGGLGIWYLVDAIIWTVRFGKANREPWMTAESKEA
jgi:TM2 domain-containing membrane protein YozV